MQKSKGLFPPVLRARVRVALGYTCATPARADRLARSAARLTGSSKRSGAGNARPACDYYLWVRATGPCLSGGAGTPSRQHSPRPGAAGSAGAPSTAGGPGPRGTAAVNRQGAPEPRGNRCPGDTSRRARHGGGAARNLWPGPFRGSPAGRDGGGEGQRSGRAEPSSPVPAWPRSSRRSRLPPPLPRLPPSPLPFPATRFRPRSRACLGYATAAPGGLRGPRRPRAAGQGRAARGAVRAAAGSGPAAALRARSPPRLARRPCARPAPPVSGSGGRRQVPPVPLSLPQAAAAAGWLPARCAAPPPPGSRSRSGSSPDPRAMAL